MSSKPRSQSLMATQEGAPLGHGDKSQSTISFNNSTRTFTITPVATKFDVWCVGKRYEFTTAQSVSIPNTTGLYYIYFSSAGVLSQKSTYFEFSTDTMTATVYWNATTSTATLLADERHGITLDWQTHEYLHNTAGASYSSGFAASNYTTAGTGSSNSDCYIDIANGIFYDEDLKIAITHSATPAANTWQQVLQNNAQIPVLYLNGTAEWVLDTATSYPLKQGTARPKYNLNTAGTWSTVDIAEGAYAVSWIVATNNVNYPIVAIIAQSSLTTSAAAEALDFTSLTLTNLPIAEYKPIYKLVFQGSSAYANTPKAKLVSIWDIRSAVTTTATLTGLQTLSNKTLNAPTINNSILSGSLTAGTTTAGSNAAGNATIGGGVFNGSAYAVIADDAAMRPGTGDFTVEFWMKCVTSVGNARVFGKGNYATAGNLQLEYSGGNGNLLVHINASFTSYVNPVTMVNGNWYHIAISRNSGNVNVFVNGLKSASGPATQAGNINSTSPLYICSNGGANNFNGQITNFRYVVGTGLYTSAFTPPTTELTAVTNTQLLMLFDNGTSATLQDHSGNNRTITNTSVTQGPLYVPTTWTQPSVAGIGTAGQVLLSTGTGLTWGSPVTAGVGLTLTGTNTIALPTTGVAAGVWQTASNGTSYIYVPEITVDAYGRITNITQTYFAPAGGVAGAYSFGQIYAGPTGAMTAIVPDSDGQSLSILAGSNVTITGDNGGKSITISATGGSSSGGSLTWQTTTSSSYQGSTTINYTNQTTSGQKVYVAFFGNGAASWWISTPPFTPGVNWQAVVNNNNWVVFYTDASSSVPSSQTWYFGNNNHMIYTTWTTTTNSMNINFGGDSMNSSSSFYNYIGPSYNKLSTMLLGSLTPSIDMTASVVTAATGYSSVGSKKHPLDSSLSVIGYQNPSPTTNSSDYWSINNSFNTYYTASILNG